MKIQIHSIHFDTSDRLSTFIEKKMNKLETFYDRVLNGEVFLRLNNEGQENKTAEIKLNLPGDQLFAKENAKTFEEAVDNACEALRRQIRRHKVKTTPY